VTGNAKRPTRHRQATELAGPSQLPIDKKSINPGRKPPRLDSINPDQKPPRLDSINPNGKPSRLDSINRDRNPPLLHSMNTDRKPPQLDLIKVDRKKSNAVVESKLRQKAEENLNGIGQMTSDRGPSVIKHIRATLSQEKDKKMYRTMIESDTYLCMSCIQMLFCYLA
jgi:hypothetical protein